MLGWIVNHPQDVLKTRMQCREIPIGMVECSREIYNSSGYMGFWRGLMPCLARSLLSGAFRFLAYEECKSFMYR